jgi:hypothetical protein
MSRYGRVWRSRRVHSAYLSLCKRHPSAICNLTVMPILDLAPRIRVSCYLDPHPEGQDIHPLFANEGCVFWPRASYVLLIALDS